MIPVRLHICNNAELIAVRTDKFKSGSLTMALPIAEDENYKAYSMLFSILSSSCKKYPIRSSLRQYMEQLYDTEISTYYDVYSGVALRGFTADILDQDYLLDKSDDLLSNVAKLMYEMLFHPLLDTDGLLDETYVELERNDIINDIRAQKTNPNILAYLTFYTSFHRGYNKGFVRAYDETYIQSITRESLTNMWKKICNECPIYFFYVGSKDPSDVAKSLKRIFGNSIKNDRFATPYVINPIMHMDSQPLRVETDAIAKQAQMRFGFTTGIANEKRARKVLNLANEILGGSSSSRLFTNIRERDGMCYSIQSSFNPHYSTLVISCGTNNANLSIVEENILHEIAIMKNGAFSDEDISRAKKNYESALAAVYDTSQSIEVFHFFKYLSGNYATPEQLFKEYDSITREEIMEYANCLHLDTIHIQRAKEESTTTTEEN